MRPITARLLASLSTKEKPELMAPLASAMNEFFPKFEIVTEPRQETFLAQSLHEADGFHTLQEYASGAAYEGRADLGNVKKGDGVRFKGGGIFQNTGRGNYTKLTKQFREMGEVVDLVANPELLRTPRYAVLAACLYWKEKKLNALADLNTPASFKAMTKKINGGYNGLADRIAYLEKCRAAIIEDAKPAGQVGPGSPPEQIKLLQKALADKGYPVGGLDGRWGRMTRDAVMSFKADSFLDVTDPSLSISDVMLSKPKVIPTRVDATVSDLRSSGSTTVAGADKVEVASYLAGAGALGSSALDRFEFASGIWQRVKWAWEPLNDTFGWLLSNPFFYVAIIAGVAIYYARRVKAKRLEEFKQGKVQ